METTLVQARGWINASGVGWILACKGLLRWVALRPGELSWVAASSVAEWHGYSNHHAVGAVPASTPVGGIGLVTARLGKARRVEARHGESTIVVGTAAASTPRGGVESRLTEITELRLKGAKDGTPDR